jgi:purine-nucleoside phosphorylase
MSYEKAAEAAEYIRLKGAAEARTGNVLGSGLGPFADDLEGTRIPFSEIPGFAQTTITGHAGYLLLTEIERIPIIVQQGRFHFYEGHEMEQVVFPIRVFGLLGVRNLILTNAAGSLNTDMPPGSLVVLTDHLNCIGVNPLRGTNDERFGPRFPDMSEVYCREFHQIAIEEATAIAGERLEGGRDTELREFLHSGVYCGLSGPTYETPAEIRMLRSLGADVVGMSTVPEAMAARHQGIKVLGISCVTNYAAGMTAGAIEHGHVIETGLRTAEVFGELITRIVKRI